MVKELKRNIILHFDKEFFYKLKEDKLRREKDNNCFLTWEVYFALLFGQTKLNGGKKQ
jgi:hypothetical protein